MELSKEEKDKIEQAFEEISALAELQNKLYENLLEDLGFDDTKAEAEPYLFDAVYNSSSNEDLDSAINILEKQIKEASNE